MERTQPGFRAFASWRTIGFALACAIAQSCALEARLATTLVARVTVPSAWSEEVGAGTFSKAVPANLGMLKLTAVAPGEPSPVVSWAPIVRPGTQEAVFTGVPVGEGISLTLEALLADPDTGLPRTDERPICRGEWTGTVSAGMAALPVRLVPLVFEESLGTVSSIGSVGTSFAVDAGQVSFYPFRTGSAYPGGPVHYSIEGEPGGWLGIFRTDGTPVENLVRQTGESWVVCELESDTDYVVGVAAPRDRAVTTSMVLKTTRFVDPSAPVGGDGSFASPWTNFAGYVPSMGAGHYAVFVAGGVYPLASAFVLNDDVAMYGGFAVSDGAWTRTVSGATSRVVASVAYSGSYLVFMASRNVLSGFDMDATGIATGAGATLYANNASSGSIVTRCRLAGNPRNTLDGPQCAISVVAAEGLLVDRCTVTGGVYPGGFGDSRAIDVQTGLSVSVTVRRSVVVGSIGATHGSGTAIRVEYASELSVGTLDLYGNMLVGALYQAPGAGFSPESGMEFIRGRGLDFYQAMGHAGVLSATIRNNAIVSGAAYEIPSNLGIEFYGMEVSRGFEVDARWNTFVYAELGGTWGYGPAECCGIDLDGGDALPFEIEGCVFIGRSEPTGLNGQAIRCHGPGAGAQQLAASRYVAYVGSACLQVWDTDGGVEYSVGGLHDLNQGTANFLGNVGIPSASAFPGLPSRFGPSTVLSTALFAPGGAYASSLRTIPYPADVAREYRYDLASRFRGAPGANWTMGAVTY